VAYSPAVMAKASIAFLLLSVALAAPGTSSAAKAKKAGAGAPAPACGIRSLPLYAGASWTYKSGPDEMKLVVTSVGPGKDATGNAVTAIDVEETYSRKPAPDKEPVVSTQKLTWTCTAAGLRIDPLSFYYTGEAGGVFGSELKITKRDGVWLPPDASLSTGSGWEEKLEGDIVRTDLSGKGVTHPPATVSVQRVPTVGEVEAVNVAAGSFTARKVAFQLRAQAVSGGEKFDVLIDATNPGGIWFAKDVGIVKYEDNLKTRRSWELVATSVPIK
jgi:hypothetical protein